MGLGDNAFVLWIVKAQDFVVGGRLKAKHHTRRNAEVACRLIASYLPLRDNIDFTDLSKERCQELTNQPCCDLLHN
jgi:hypothetical protein